jgi:hypothetical protein
MAGERRGVGSNPEHGRLPSFARENGVCHYIDRARPSVKRPTSDTLHNTGSRHPLLDHLVGLGEQRRRWTEVEYFCCLEIDDQLEVRALNNRQLCWRSSVALVSGEGKPSPVCP